MGEFKGHTISIPHLFGDSSDDESAASEGAGNGPPLRDVAKESLDLVMSDDPVVLQHRLGKLQLSLRSSQILQELQQAQVAMGAVGSLGQPRDHLRDFAHPKIQSTLSANARLRHLASLHSSERERLAEALRLTEAEVIVVPTIPPAPGLTSVSSQMARRDGTDRIGLAVLRGELLEEKSRSLEMARNCTRKAISDKEATREKMSAMSAQLGAEVRALREMNYRMREQIAQRTVLFSARQKEMEEFLRGARDENAALNERNDVATRESTENAGRALSLEKQLKEMRSELEQTKAQLEDERMRAASSNTLNEQLQEDLGSATAAIERLSGELEDVRSSNFTEVERAMYSRLTEEEAKSASFKSKYMSALKNLEKEAEKSRNASQKYEDRLTHIKKLCAGKIQRMRSRFQRRVKRINDERQGEQKQVLLNLRAEAEAILAKANAVKSHHEELLRKEQERISYEREGIERTEGEDSHLD